jgi:NDP-sugar pyrophosphorylase family protein
MTTYRPLTDDEIITLEEHGCTAEDWTYVNVADDFTPSHIKDVRFCGTVNLGVFEKNVEVGQDFYMHSGVRNATLRNVTIGDNSLVENIGNYISNYVIGEECCIRNVCTIETTAEATFGEGNTISVLNEAGSGNVVLFRGLTSNLAALMVSRPEDKELSATLKAMAKDYVNSRHTDAGTIGDYVRIINTTEITNTNIADNCEVNGACRLSDCTLAAEADDSVYIGSGVICENSIIADGSSVLNSAKLFNCYVGEACQITNGFTAESSLFFANTYMANGEACAAFCGPFSASHHKSTLLIGCMTSFYNAGSGTNFSNHAYKMGPIHYGTLSRGVKTASGSHIVHPAKIGSFSVCMGKIQNHPDTTALPFSYVIGEGRETHIVPGRNIATVGLYRDINKWPRRDVRIKGSRKSIINYEWLSPLTVNEVVKGHQLLANMRQNAGQKTAFCTADGNTLTANALEKGMKLYAMAVEMYVGEMLARHEDSTPAAASGTGEWCDLGGLLIPAEEEERLVEKIRYGMIDGIGSVIRMFEAYNDRYGDYQWAFTLNLMKGWLGKDELTEDDFEYFRGRGMAAHEAWLNMIREDAEKEYSLGDVDRATLDKFLAQLG